MAWNKIDYVTQFARIIELSGGGEELCQTIFQRSRKYIMKKLMENLDVARNGWTLATSNT